MFKSDDRVGLIDYVPPGSIARGRAIAKSGGGAGMPCATCHGEAFAGAGAVPPLAGRPAAYLARPLWDIRAGARQGATAKMMQVPARGLTPSQIVDVTAYLASRTP